MTKTAMVFECQSCGYQSGKWLGRCPDCGSWNSFVEEKKSSTPKSAKHSFRGTTQAQPLSAVSTENAPRIRTTNSEFDRVLGGGVVPGSLVLLGGEPGVGKSTLLLQVAQTLVAQGRRVLYVSGEESAHQIKLRAERLEVPAGETPDQERPSGGTPAAELYVLSESSLERIFESISEVKPTDLVIDSVQTTFSETLDSAPGSISQVRYVATALLNLAKSCEIPVFLIGHVTKDGSIAGPKSLEHIVDTVLYFEGERHHNHRIVRAVKNRFGAANEVGVFEMSARGLLPVTNPSVLFLRERTASAPGSAVTCTMEGTRPLMVEVQALVSSTQYSTARRMATGFDYNRISLLVAMLEKRLGLPLLGCDIYVNVAGGLEVDEPASDLAVVSAILSSFRNRPIQMETVLIGELGLSGEVRPVNQIHPRIREVAAMGFRRCLLPQANLPLVDKVEGVELLPIRSVAELSDLIFEA